MHSGFFSCENLWISAIQYSYVSHTIAANCNVLFHEYNIQCNSLVVDLIYTYCNTYQLSLGRIQVPLCSTRAMKTNKHIITHFEFKFKYVLVSYTQMIE